MKSQAFFALALGAAFLLQPAMAASRKAEIARGRYLAAIMDCGTCHTDGTFIGKPDLAHPLAGSAIAHEVPGLGTFWPPNLTPDDETGLGKWSLAEIMTAIRHGRRPDGRELAPAMPWRAYSHLTDSDARALAIYLKSLPPLKGTVRPPAGPGVAVPGVVVKVVAPAP